MASSETSAPTITRLPDPPTYQDFLANFLLPNIPVIIGPKLVQDWPALTQWTRREPPVSDVAGRPSINWEFLADRFGHHKVTIADCAHVDSFGNLECRDAVFRDVVSEWERGEGQSSYVKDWHLARAVEEPSSREPGIPFYTTPGIFEDDWMNAYYSAHTADDFRFVYVGAASTYTPLHRDVYCSYSWSTNVCGRKRWWLFPPDQTRRLFMRERNVCVHDVRNVDSKQFPEFHRAEPIVVDQEDGETIFVPSGWYHQVVNLTDCISINHNWCNSVNLLMLYASMCEKVEEVEHALEDVRDMLRASNSEGEAWKREFSAVVQGLVQQDAGWNWSIFWKMILHVLRDATAETHTLTRSPPDGIFPCAAPHLRPTRQFTYDQVRSCHDGFVARERYECEGDIRKHVDEVVTILNLNHRFE